MLLYQHLMYGSLFSVGVLLATYAMLGSRFAKLALIVCAGILAANLCDIDHYMGSWEGLASCALKTTAEEYKSTPYCVALERGVFHQFRVGVGLLALLAGWAVYYRKDGIGLWDIAALSLGSVCLMFATFRQVFPYVLFYFVGALILSKYIVKTKNIYYGLLVAGLLLGWGLHMHLDLLLRFWWFTT